MSAKKDVVFFCWRCGQKLAVPDTLQGRDLPCPRCDCPLSVPSGNNVIKRDIPDPDETQAPVADELVVTENDMTFNCIHCDWFLIMDKRGAGLTVPCPGCGRLIQVPQPQETPPAQAETAEPAAPPAADPQ